MAAARWTSLSDSPFPWEAEALSWLADHLPGAEPYRGWSNFEFVAHDGSVNEVDALVLTPKQLLLVEIKSRPGLVTGDLGQWTWEQPGGKTLVIENPLILANRKAKRLKGLLQGATGLKGKRIPYIGAAVFLSHRKIDCKLTGPAGTSVFTRAGYHPERDLLAYLRADADAPGERIEFQQAKAVIKALEEVGLRKIQREFTVGDWRLTQLLQETDVYQDWTGTHVRNAQATRRIRLYPWPATGPETGRAALRRAADREFSLLERVEHPGILRAYDQVETERGYALLFEDPEPAERFDAFLVRRARQLDLRQRLKLVREIADALTYAHGRHLYHRALTPHAVLLTHPDSENPGVKLLNWQLGALDDFSTGETKLSWHDFLQVGLGGQDANAVYLAPELRSGGRPDPALLDMFSLGALTYHLLTGQPPAATAEELLLRLRDGKGLQLAAALDGVDGILATLVELATAPDLGERLDDVATFLAEVDQLIGKLTADVTEPGQYVHPLDAEAGAELEGGFLVRRRLGSGSTALALEVERDQRVGVLKVARTQELNERVEQEGEILKRLRHQHVVELFEVTQVSGHTALFIALAGQQTLAQRLRQEGALTLDLLQRFGEELLTVVDWLEQKGIPHRDLKPDNIGVGETRTGKRTLLLFDFSLSSTPAENVRAGTPGYLDPFLSERRPQRWDTGAERYAAAVTLYEMATGALPQWGDGRQHPVTLPDQASVAVAVERLDPAVREPLAKFFRKALARDPRARFDTAEEMRRAWIRLFEAIDRPATVTDSGTTGVGAALAAADVATPLAALGLTPRVLNALERLGVQQVGELAELPRTKLYGMQGIGLGTKREIKELADAAARTLAERGAPAISDVAPELDDVSVDPRLWSVDLLARQLVSGKLPTPEPQVLKQITGFAAPVDAEAQDAWPSQRDVAEGLGLSRTAVADVVDRARARWAKKPWMTLLREDVARLLESHGGIATREELAQAVLLARGSTETGPSERLRKASAVLWAALEIEAARETSWRYRLQRGERLLLVVSTVGEQADLFADAGTMLRWVEALGEKADALALVDPPLPPQRALEELGTIAVPVGVPPFTPERLLRLAVSASCTAALSPRQELYPQGFAAERALALGAGALIGAGRLTVDQVRQRIASRYPEAKPLPERPALDRLLTEAGLALRWDEASQSYVQMTPGSGSLTSTGPLTWPSTIAGPADPAVEAAAEFERRLQAVVAEGRFLALTVDPRHLLAAEEMLLTRFSLQRRSLEQVLLDAMREQAALLGVAWPVVLAADARTNDREWRNLQMLVQKARPTVERVLGTLDEPTLLVHPGLFARYGLLPLLQPLQDRARRGGGVVLLTPADGQQDLPVVDGVTLPVVYATDWARLPKAWLRSARPGTSAAGSSVLQTTG